MNFLIKFWVCSYRTEYKIWTYAIAFLFLLVLFLIPFIWIVLYCSLHFPQHLWTFSCPWIFITVMKIWRSWNFVKPSAPLPNPFPTWLVTVSDFCNAHWHLVLSKIKSPLYCKGWESYLATQQETIKTKIPHSFHQFLWVLKIFHNNSSISQFPSKFPNCELAFPQFSQTANRKRLINTHIQRNFFIDWFWNNIRFWHCECKNFYYYFKLNKEISNTQQETELKTTNNNKTRSYLKQTL